MRRLLATAGALIVVSAALPLVMAQTSTPGAAPPPRANPVIKLLEQGKPAFSIWANYIGVGKDYHAAVTLQNNKNFDFIIYDLEHDPLDVAGLSEFLRDLLDPGGDRPRGRERHQAGHRAHSAQRPRDPSEPVDGEADPRHRRGRADVPAHRDRRAGDERHQGGALSAAGRCAERAAGRRARRQQRDCRALLGHEQPRVRAAVRRVGPAPRRRHAHPAHHREQAGRGERARHRPHAEGRQHQVRAVGRRRRHEPVLRPRREADAGRAHQGDRGRQGVRVAGRHQRHGRLQAALRPGRAAVLRHRAGVRRQRTEGHAGTAEGRGRASLPLRA